MCALIKENFILEIKEEEENGKEIITINDNYGRKFCGVRPIGGDRLDHLKFVLNSYFEQEKDPNIMYNLRNK